MRFCFFKYDFVFSLKSVFNNNGGKKKDASHVDSKCVTPLFLAATNGEGGGRRGGGFGVCDSGR